MQKNIFDMAGRAVQTNMVGVQELKKIVIPLPSIIEQNEILSKYKYILAIIDELEKQVADRKEKAEQLMQAVLREAFEGGCKDD
jgi:restriction endonuclease S subunit